VNRTTAELREVAAEYGPAAISKLAAMAGLTGPGAESEQTQLGALRELLDRGFGRATTHTAGDDGGAVRIHVITGVPRAEPEEESHGGDCYA
jgi:hypothetical protein